MLYKIIRFFNGRLTVPFCEYWSMNDIKQRKQTAKNNQIPGLSSSIKWLGLRSRQLANES